ncbi:hypothetical protein AVEN_172728-1 [Araneus ventricosus]|uniref:Uncharacterized protein n=1 Tax=Araneus ventricosus TaxID=182803 RepID=A0A4Y2ULE8_ARAVE|nr:hypothetical protein AVEN_172728-1 [Araneus ventricosus]
MKKRQNDASFRMVTESHLSSEKVKIKIQCDKPISFGTSKRDLIEKLGIEDLERSVVLIKPSLELEPTTFCDASVTSFTHRSTAWELVELPLICCSI